MTDPGGGRRRPVDVPVRGRIPDVTYPQISVVHRWPGAKNPQTPSWPTARRGSTGLLLLTHGIATASTTSRSYPWRREGRGRETEIVPSVLPAPRWTAVDSRPPAGHRQVDFTAFPNVSSMAEGARKRQQSKVNVPGVDLTGHRRSKTSARKAPLPHRVRCWQPGALTARCPRISPFSSPPRISPRDFGAI